MPILPDARVAVYPCYPGRRTESTMATIPLTLPDQDVAVDVQPLQGIGLDEFLALPEIKPALEYDEGRVSQKVPPQGKHSVLQAQLVELFNAAGRPHKIARAFPELRFTFGHGSVVPDVAVYTWSSISRTTAGEIAEEFRTPPEIAVEILSPQQGAPELREKCQSYLGYGTRVALLVNPPRRLVEVFEPGVPPTVYRGGDAIDLTAVIPSFSLSIDSLFDALRAD